MSKARRLLLRAALAGVALAILAAAAGVLVLRSDWFREQVRARIIREAERATGGRVELRAFRFYWRTLEAEVTDFLLHGKEGPEESPLFRARSVRVGLRVQSLLRRDIVLENVVLAEPQLHLSVYQDGSTNLPEPAVARQRRNPVEQFLALAIRRFRMDRGLVEVNDRRFPLNLTGENLTTRMFYERGGPRYRGQISVKKLMIAGGPARVPPLDADFSVALEKDRLSVDRVRLNGGASTVEGQAVLENLASPRIQASYEGQIAAENWLPPGTQAKVHGRIDLQGDFSYSDGKYVAAAKVNGTGLSLRMAAMTIPRFGLSAELQASPGQLEIPRIQINALGGIFRGTARLADLRKFQWAGQVDGVSLVELARLRGIQDTAWAGSVSGPASIEAEIAEGKAKGVKGKGEFSIQASAEGRPVEGHVDATFDQSRDLVEVRNSWFSTPAAKARFDGELQHRIRVSAEISDLADLVLAAKMAGLTMPSTLPVELKGGQARFEGEVSGKLENPRIEGRLAATGLVYEGRAFDRLETRIAAVKDELEVSSLTLLYRGARLEGSGRLGWKDWKPGPDSPVRAVLNLRGLPLEEVLKEVGGKAPPAEGLLRGSFRLSGTPESLEGAGTLELTRASAYGQKLDSARADLQLKGRSVVADPIRFVFAKAPVEGQVRFEALRETWAKGVLSFAVKGRALRLAQMREIANLNPALDAVTEFHVEGEAEVGDRISLSLLHGNASLRDITWNQKPAGRLEATAETQGDLLEITSTGQGVGAPVSARVQIRMTGDHPTEGELRFGRISLGALSQLAGGGQQKDLPVEVSAEGKFAFSGSLGDRTNWKGRLELVSMEIQPEAGENNGALRLLSVSPVVVAVTRKQAAIQSARFAGAGSNIDASGRVVFASRGPEYDLRLLGTVNLEILRNLDRNITAAGISDVDITVRGKLVQPDVYGRVRLKNASLYLRGIPNGIDSANGEIFVFRDRATVEKLTARTGSGTLEVSGFIGFGGEQPFYQMKAEARQVRVRYPEGVSTTFDARLELRGTARRSLLTGQATVLRTSFSPNLDFASVLSRPAQPMAPPAAPNELLNGMQLDVAVTTAPNARFDNALARNLQAEADLKIQGSPYKPILLGRITVNQGEINFLGNRYRISRGDITFANPLRLEPLLDLDLNTRVRGVDVTMNFTGPLDKLNLTYRSDPPLQVNEIIALLAVGRAPASDPAVLARQTEQDQSWQQVGASTLIGTAFETLEGGRLQRFFGVSRIKIDPKLTGLGTVPEAQLTLEQQISRDITFTYVTKLAQEQQQLVRVEWNISRQWSLLAVRDENGLFGIEVQFRRQFK